VPYVTDQCLASRGDQLSLASLHHASLTCEGVYIIRCRLAPLISTATVNFEWSKKGSWGARRTCPGGKLLLTGETQPCRTMARLAAPGK
jgi:hypothetical protein